MADGCIVDDSVWLQRRCAPKPEPNEIRFSQNIKPFKCKRSDRVAVPTDSRPAFNHDP